MEFGARVEVIKRLKNCSTKMNLGLNGEIGLFFYENSTLCARLLFSHKARSELVKLAKEILRIDKDFKKYLKEEKK